jgi:hypothetical protein
MVKIFEPRVINEQVKRDSWETLKNSFSNTDLVMNNNMWKTLTRVIYHNAKRLFYNYLFEEKNKNSDYKELLDSVTELGNHDEKKDYVMARGPTKFIQWWEAQKNEGNTRAAISSLKNYIQTAKRTDVSGESIFIYKKTNWRDLDSYTDSYFNKNFEKHYGNIVKKRQRSKYHSSSSGEEEKKSKSTRSRTRSRSRPRTRVRRCSPQPRSRPKRKSRSRRTLKAARSDARASVRARQNSAANKYKKINT